MIASSLLRYPTLDEHSKKLFDAYDEFLEMMADETTLIEGKKVRKHLDDLPIDLLGSDETATKGREISHRFRDAIGDIFLSDQTELGRMTIEYGVF
jgi:hypothetical protein